MSSADPAAPDRAGADRERPARGSRSGPEEQRLQGHWLLARLGKRVLRPGGRALTARLLAAARPGAGDRIVEFGPGLGHTARLLLAAGPAEYIAVDPGTQGREALARVLAGHRNARVVAASADESGLPSGCADLVVGEAMLSMQDREGKQRIVAEAARLLAPGGRYAIHELVVTGERAPEISREISRTIKVGARPLPQAGWEDLLAGAGLEVEWSGGAPMRLLEPSRVVADEGLPGALRFAWNLLRNAPARKRVLAMRRTFRENRDHLGAIALVARRPAPAGPDPAA